MALVVEDGTGKADAESYISVANAQTYLTSRGNLTFAAAISDAIRENALRNATDYMVAQYRYAWAGYRLNSVQALDWPRAYVPLTDIAGGYGPSPLYLPIDSVPALVGQACADLAVRALVGSLAPDIARLKRSVTVGPIRVEYQPYMTANTVFVAVLNKLAPFLLGQGMGRVQLVRT